ncbi:hypothetical protein [Massilia sp. TSP1-1-2]|uniref:hypothetical protein n=1 Tax=unclassified Massilia TaxID=2609279 RepID=UPI003CEBF507
MSKLLMVVSAAFMATIGLLLIFAPQELLGTMQGVQHPALLPAVQLLGALYVGGAITNWMSKSHLVGGVFGRPLAMGNLTHFGIGGMALVRIAAGAEARLWPLAILYVLLAAAFGAIIVGQPKAAVT